MSILSMSLSGGIIILAVLLVRRVGRGKLPTRFVLFLWGAALIRLLVPFSLPFEYSAYSFIGRIDPAQTLAFPASGLKPSGAVEPDVVSPGVNKNEHGGAETQTAQTMPAQIKELSSANVFKAVYFAAGGTMLAAFAVSWAVWRFRFAKDARNAGDDSAIKEILDGCRFGRRFAVRFSGRVSTPLTYGILSPVILLPEGIGRNNKETLVCVLSHEYMHVRHLDALKKFFLALALCAHWFNPLVWVMYFAANKDIEFARDEAVIRRLGECSRKRYALALLDMEESRQRYTVFASAFGKSAVEERVKAIVKGTKRSVTAIIAASLAVGAIFTLFATSASADKPSGKEIAGSHVDLTETLRDGAGVVRWPEEFMPDGFPVPEYEEIYSVLLEDGEIGLVLFGNKTKTGSDALSFVMRLTDAGWLQYDEIESERRYYCAPDGCIVSVAVSNEWTGEHLNSINEISPTGFTYEIKVKKNAAISERLFQSFPDAGTDLGLEPTVFSEWPENYLSENFPRPGNNVEIVGAQQRKNGIFITLRGEATDVIGYLNEIKDAMGFINSSVQPYRNENGDYMFYENLEYSIDGNLVKVTDRLQFCPANTMRVD